MVFFVPRAAMTIFKVGPKFLKFKNATVFGIKTTKNPTSGKIVASKFVEAKLSSVGINIALEVSGGNRFLASVILGGTIRPLTGGRVTSVDQAGEISFGALRSIAPGGRPIEFGNLAKVVAPATVLPFVRGEVIGEVLELAGTPKFIINFLDIAGLF